jgi:hypothetical protein
MKVPRVHFWFAMLATVSAVACAIALFLATLGTAGGTALAASDAAKPAQPQATQSEIYEGIITDTRCGAKHSAGPGLSAGDCTRACVHGGEHFALVDGDKMYTLNGDPAALKHVAGERAKIAGTLNGDTIAVSSVAQ